jgi:hypothetical protein
MECICWRRRLKNLEKSRLVEIPPVKSGPMEAEPKTLVSKPRKRYSQQDLLLEKLYGGEFIKREFADLVPFSIADCQVERCNSNRRILPFSY